MGEVILLSNHITQIPIFFSSFSTRLTEAKSILLQLKTLPGCPCPRRTLLGHPLPSSCSSLLQMVSDPISSCAQQMEILTLCTLLHNFPLSLQAAFLQLPASCAFLTWFWLHFLPINLLHFCPVTSNTILPITGSSSHFVTILVTEEGWLYWGESAVLGSPFPWPCLLCSWQTPKPQPSLC